MDFGVHIRRAGGALMGFRFDEGSGSVLASMGRGSAKRSVTVSMHEIEEWARRNADRMPALIRRASGAAANILRNQLKSVMKSAGGKYHVPKFAPYQKFTTDLRAARGHSGPFGGVLASTVTRWKSGDIQYVGWSEMAQGKSRPISELAIAFQDGEGGADAEVMFIDPRFRHGIHKLGVKDIPRSYVSVKRDVLTSFGAHIDDNLEAFKKKRLSEAIAKQLAKDKDIFREAS